MAKHLTQNNVSIRLVLDGHNFSAAENEEAITNRDTQLLLATAKTTIVPADILASATLEAWLDAAGMPLADDEDAVCGIERDGKVAVMAVSCKLLDDLRRLRPDALRAQSPLLIDTSVKHGTVLTLHGSLLYMRYYDERLLFAEVVEVRSDADIYYHLQQLDNFYNIYNIGVSITPANAHLNAVCRHLFKQVKCE